MENFYHQNSSKRSIFFFYILSFHIFSLVHLMRFQFVFFMKYVFLVFYSNINLYGEDHNSLYFRILILHIIYNLHLLQQQKNSFEHTFANNCLNRHFAFDFIRMCIHVVDAHKVRRQSIIVKCRFYIMVCITYGA